MHVNLSKPSFNYNFSYRVVDKLKFAQRSAPLIQKREPLRSAKLS